MPISLLAFEVWWLAQATPAPEDPTFWLTSLGAFSVAAAVGWFFLRDTIRQRDRAVAAVEAYGPVLTEVRDVLRTNSETLRDSTAAMSAMAEALKSLPTVVEVTRLRDALDRVERRSPRSSGSS